MTEITSARAIPTINAVDGFNPADFTRELTNDDGTKSLYLDVKYRLLWFRLHCPDGKIDSEIIRVDDKSAVVSCKLYNSKSDPADQYVARSTAQRFLSQDKFGDRYLEIAETAAIGRVLAAAGYGTQFCGSGDMLSGDIVDVPIDLPEDTDDAPQVMSHVTHQTVAQPTQAVAFPQKPAVVAAAPQPAPAPAPKPALPSVEFYLNTMTLEDAKNVVVDIGRYAGSTLGEIALRKPSDLEWYVKFYSGKNHALKAGAMLLVQAATQKAS